MADIAQDISGMLGDRRVVGTVGQECCGWVDLGRNRGRLEELSMNRGDSWDERGDVGKEDDRHLDGVGDKTA